MKNLNDTQLGLKQGDLKIIIGTIKSYKEITTAIVFGSRAMGNYKNGSDIAIKGDNASSVAHSLAGVLNDESPLPYMFDIISYENINNPSLKKHIDEKGKQLF